MVQRYGCGGFRLLPTNDGEYIRYDDVIEALKKLDKL